MHRVADHYWRQLVESICPDEARVTSHRVLQQLVQRESHIRWQAKREDRRASSQLAYDHLRAIAKLLAAECACVFDSVLNKGPDRQACFEHSRLTGRVSC